MIILSCGHSVDDFEHAFDVVFKTTDRKGEKALSCSSVCGSCKDEYRQRGELFESDEHGYAWLDKEEW